jgi:hypothetical protein
MVKESLLAKLAKRRPGPPRSPHRATVAELYRQGKRPADIARLLKVTRQWVSAMLLGAGVNASAAKQRLREEADAEFQSVWEAAPDLTTAARKLGLAPKQALIRASWLRRRGMPLIPSYLNP